MPEEAISAKRAHVARAVLIGSLGVSTLLAVGIGCQKTAWAVVPPVLIVLTTVLCLAAGSRQIGRFASRFALLVATLNLVLLVPEFTLRLIGFRYETGIHFGYPRPTEFIRYDYDRDLFWKLPASEPRVNSFGFPGREVEIPKPDNVFRIAFLGDSCTQAGYPDMVETLLNTGVRAGVPRVECVTLAVAGYSSHQGQIVAEKYAVQCEPDLVFVCYGWNDHWLAYGAIDALKTADTYHDFAPARFLSWLNSKSRILQVGQSLRADLHWSTGELLEEVRVSPIQYRNNLAIIHDVVSAAGALVVFMTAPTSHYRDGVPDFLVELNFVRDKASATRLHMEYNNIVRQIATEYGAHLIDLEAIFSSLPHLERVFTKDGIHFAREGLGLVAATIVDFVNVNRAIPEGP